jgi:hypothetical protein
MTKLWPICQWLLALFDIRFLPVSWSLLMFMGSYCICCWVHPLLVGGFVAGVIKIYPAVLMASGKIHHLVRWFYRCVANVWMIFHEVRNQQVSLLGQAAFALLGQPHHICVKLCIGLYPGFATSEQHIPGDHPVNHSKPIPSLSPTNKHRLGPICPHIVLLNVADIVQYIPTIFPSNWGFLNIYIYYVLIINIYIYIMYHITINKRHHQLRHAINLLSFKLSLKPQK